MRKQTKLVAVVSAAALLAIGASMTSFAATGWVEEGGEWFFYDKDGTKAEDVWKKSGDKWFWMDSEENGAMAIDKLVEDGDNIYYVDATGAMVSNTWVKVVNEDQDDEDDPAEYNYYYMQANGKAYKGGDKTSTKTIDGKRYAFDSEGKMLYGWVNDGSARMSGEDAWSEYDINARYFGNWDDGAMKTGWQKISVVDNDEDKDYWFFFNSNGTRFANKADDASNDKTLRTKKVNGKTYGFDERGVMVYEWNVVASTADGSTASDWSYFNSPEDGARVTKGWFKVVPPSDDSTFTDGITESFDESGAYDESNNWYYADDKGNLYANAIKSIKGKYYAFNAKGKMLSGLVLLDVGANGEINSVVDDGVDSDELDRLMNDTYESEYDKTIGSATLYYFGSDADSDGAMKTGAATVSLDGDTHNFLFSKTGGVENRGKGFTGVDDKKYIYKYGKRIKADSDQKYVVVTVEADGSVVINDSIDYRTDNATTEEFNTDGDPVVGFKEFNQKTDADKDYLVNVSGTITKTKTAAKDGDDWYFYVKDGNIVQYTSNKSLKGTSFDNWN